MKFSIVTPSLNHGCFIHGCFIEEAIDSVSSQGLLDVEQIVVDGASSDSTTDKLACAPAAVRWTSTRDRGLAHAVNKGIQACDGDVLGWLNANDRYHPGALAKVQECFERFPSVDVVYGKGEKIDEDGDYLGKISVVQWHVRKRWRRRNLCQPAVFVRKKAMEKIGMLDETLKYRPDYDLWLRLLDSGAQFKRIDETLASVREHCRNRGVSSPDALQRARVQLEVIKILSRYDRQIAVRWLLTYGEAIAEWQGISRVSRQFDRCVIDHACDAQRQFIRGDFALRLMDGDESDSDLQAEARSAPVVLNLGEEQKRFNRVKTQILLRHGRRELKQILRRPRFLARFLPRSQLLESLFQDVFEKKLFRLHNYPPREMEIPAFYLASSCCSKSPKISIVTPNWNQGQYIGDTIESVINQQYPSLDYTVQDGNSTDNSVEVIRQYASKLSSWRSEPDTGQTQAINRGLARTTGEIMAYLNSDDLLLPGSLHYVADFFSRHPKVDVVYGHRVLVDEQSREIGRWVLPPHDDKVIAYADYIPQETMFWRRSAWEAVGRTLDESFRFAMDWDLLLRFRQAGLRFYRAPRFLGAFRVTADQKTSAQMATVGDSEMKRLRLRELGRKPNQREINRAVRPYMRRHWVYDKLYTMGVFNY